MSKIGFVGLGRMGAPIVSHLVAAGHEVAVFDIDPAAMGRVADARVCASIAAAATGCELFFSCVPGPADVAAVMDEAFESLPASAVIVEMSTVSPAMGRELSARAEALGIGFIDGPLSGGAAAAHAGALVMMAGGTAEEMARITPVVCCFAPRIFHLGPAGSGYLAKSINQAVYLSYVAAVCESVALGARGGLDVPVLLEVLRRSVGGMPMMTQWEVKIATQDLRPGFEVRRVLKDLSMAEAAASDLGFAMPILNTVVAAFESAATTGHTGDDMTALYQMKRVG